MLPPPSDAAEAVLLPHPSDVAAEPPSDAAVAVLLPHPADMAAAAAPPLDAAGAGAVLPLALDAAAMATVAVPDATPQNEDGPAKEQRPLAPSGDGQPLVPSGEALPLAAPSEEEQQAAVVRLASSQQLPQGGSSGAPVLVKTPGSTEGEGLGDNGEPRPADATDVFVLAGSTLMWQLLRARWIHGAEGRAVPDL